jgi:hypothetical protein
VGGFGDFWMGSFGDEGKSVLVVFVPKGYFNALGLSINIGV